jgi:hypothetical protein
MLYILWLSVVLQFCFMNEDLTLVGNMYKKGYIHVMAYNETSQFIQNNVIKNYRQNSKK